MLTAATAGAVAFAAAATALDLREALHQDDLAQGGLVAAAVAVALLHLLCALGARTLLLRNRRGAQT